MALSQVLCSLALVAILTSKGRTEKWNFWMDEGRMLGFQLREKKIIIYDPGMNFCVLGGIRAKILLLSYYPNLFS